MTTARPQQVSDEPDTSDDLIAELAKLMAQDAQGERPAQPPGIRVENAATGGSFHPAPTVPAQAGAPAQGADLRGTLNTAPEPFADWRERVKGRMPGTETAVGEEMRREPSLGVGPAAHTPAGGQATPADLDFDFGLGGQAQPVQVRPQAAPASAPVAEAGADQDAIGALIAAEMGAVHPQVPQAPTTESEHTEENAARAPEPAIDREEPRAAQARMPANVRSFTPVNANPARAGQGQPGKPVLRQLNVVPRAEPTRREQSRAEPQAPVEPVFGEHSEPDAFSVAPVFGLGGRPSAPRATPAAPAEQAPARPRDPIEEIENLIGEAVRVNLGDTEPPHTRKSPAQSLLRRATGRRAEIKQEKAEEAAEDAILAAAAVSGLDVGRVPPELDAEEVDEAPVAVRRGPGWKRQLVGPLVASTLLLASGFGLYSVLGLGQGGTGQAPLLTAEAGAVKEEAIVTPSASAGQRSAVLDEIGGVAEPEAEQLVSREELPTDEVTEVAVAEGGDETLANRKVRTVTVRPDGTIVNGDMALAASELLPIDRPNVPELPGATDQATDLLTGLAGSPLGTSALSGGASAPETAVSAATDVAAAADPATAADTSTTGTLAPVEATALTAETAPLTTEPGKIVAVDLSGKVLEGVEVPVPMPRPTFRAQNSAAAEPVVEAEPVETAASVAASPVNAIITDEPLALLDSPATGEAVDVLGALPAEQPASVAAAQPEPEAVQVASVQSAEPAPARTAAAYVQLSSQRTESDAENSLKTLASRYGSLFEGASLEIQRSDLGQRGVFYRVRLPAESNRSAKQICANIQAKGGECFAL